jgi:hypothetical protein
MTDKRLEEDTLLALALGSGDRHDRRVLPDRRTGIDRRKAIQVWKGKDRRSGAERRKGPRRQGESGSGGLMAYGRSRRAQNRKISQSDP